MLYIIFQKAEFQFASFVFLQLERAWNSLTWTEKLSLVTSVIRGITSSSDMSRNSLKVDLLPRFICYLDDPICSLLKFDKEGGRARERERFMVQRFLHHCLGFLRKFGFI
jgi:pheromone shutdown protein TraB